jgi:hypothetical protein
MAIRFSPSEGGDIYWGEAVMRDFEKEWASLSFDDNHRLLPNLLTLRDGGCLVCRPLYY